MFFCLFSGHWSAADTGQWALDEMGSKVSLWP